MEEVGSRLLSTLKPGLTDVAIMIVVFIASLGVMLALWAGLSLLRGPAWPWGLGMAAEGIAVAVAAWFASDGIAGQLLKGKELPDPWEMGWRLGRVSLAVAVVLVLAWSLAGLALCRARG